MSIRKFSYGIILMIPVILTAQNNAVKKRALTDFYLQSSAVVVNTGSELSDAGYVPDKQWLPVKVPCTVLSGLVQNKIYPDPYSGMNNMLIPDASDSFNHLYHLDQYSHLPNEPNPWKKPYWYLTRFKVPATDRGKRFELIFKGINYRAEVWLNGQMVADSAEMAGMFAQYELDVSDKIKPGGDNALAVKIYPLDFPGLPSHPQLNALGDFYDNGGPSGDIGKNVTMLSSVGWDWIPEVHDRNMGIWQPVFLRTTGPVLIKNIQVISSLPDLPDTTRASISINLELSNHTKIDREGNVELIVTTENNRIPLIHLTKKILAKSGEFTPVHFSPKDFSQLRMMHPRLWWPNGYGQANLYRIHLRFLAGGAVSEDSSFLFGIRTVSSKTESVDGFVRRDFYVNGKRVHLVGGAWVPDMMLNRDSVRNDYELHLCKNANVNLVRIWGGGIAETDDFYSIADRYGLMVWQDFWITGDTHGGFKGSADWPFESQVFIKNVISTIIRLRNHPSLLVWTGGNEGHAREELYNAMRDNVAELDGTRPFIPCSSGFSKTPSGWKASWPDDKPSGVYSGGPYSWQPDEQYYKLVNAGRDWLFKDETGLPSQPPYNSLAKIIPDLVPDTTLPFPLNNSWGYHDACTGNGKYNTYYQAMEKRYGPPKSLRDFSDKMQLLNAGGYRSIFEAVGHKLTETGGVMLWKLNAAFPSVIWQVYDWYLEPNAGYYFMKRACEPLHIQLNLDDSTVALVNRTYQAYDDLRYDVEVENMQGKTVFSKSGEASACDYHVQQLLNLKEQLQQLTGIHFVILSVKNSQGIILSENVYWMSPGHDFTALKQMPVVALQAQLTGSEKLNGYDQWKVKLSNPSQQLAFFINPQLIVHDQEVLPSFWSDNYFSIPPGKSVTVTVSCPEPALQGAVPILRIEGWNLQKQELELNHQTQTRNN
jgi:hypothetical protein